MKMLAAFAATLLLTGCYSYDVNGSRPVRYASGVQVATYDSTPRQPSASVRAFQSPAEVQRPYHVIALLSREGYLRDEGLIVNALVWRAKQMGANGIILLNVTSEGGDQAFAFGANGSFLAGSSPAQCVFTANAIVFDQ
ncbi:MAG: hypothetical protein ABSE48_21800 [Verrucomicrobiota bacterium]|jgi:hypothetical protein